VGALAAQFIPGGWCLYRKILPSKYKVVYIVLRRTAGSGYCSVAISEGSVMENPDPEGAGLWIVDRDSSAGILLKGWEFEEHQSTIPIPFLKILHFHNGQNAPPQNGHNMISTFFFRQKYFMSEIWAMPCPGRSRRCGSEFLQIAWPFRWASVPRRDASTCDQSFFAVPGESMLPSGNLT